MLQISLDKENNIVVRAEFWELDQMYFLLLRFTGDHSMYQVCPFPGYEKATSLLLALNYEIRHAEHGDRELYTQSSGISSYKIAPIGTLRELIVKEEDIHEPEELVNDVEDAIMFGTDLDLDAFYDMDEDDQRDVLDELDLNPDDEDNYLAWINRPTTYPFAREDYPEASEYNTYLQFRLRFPEAFLYALILNELIKQKDYFMHYSEKLADSQPEGDRGYELLMINRRFRPQLLFLENFSEQTFACLSEILSLDEYRHFRKIIEAPLDERSFFKDLTDDDIKKLEEVTAKSNIHSGDDLRSFLEQISC